MPKAFFISDAHLGLGTKAEEEAKGRRLIAFIDHCRGSADYLFILGDLFDAWFEYRTVIPKGYHRLFTALENLRIAGTEIHYLAGNHDFWMRDFFSTDLGIILHRDPFSIRLGDTSFLLHHGDGLAAHDLGYKILKPILRNPLSVWLYTWLHPDIGIPLARSSSKTSRGYTAGKEYGETDGMRKYAERIINEGTDVVVMGHRHLPVKETIGDGVYINLGDWITHNSYAEFDGSGIFLKTWQS
jgi:UDP-2,3-diacylglucosamine hydrolase